MPRLPLPAELQELFGGPIQRRFQLGSSEVGSELADPVHEAKQDSVKRVVRAELCPCAKF